MSRRDEKSDRKQYDSSRMDVRDLPPTGRKLPPGPSGRYRDDRPRRPMPDMKGKSFAKVQAESRDRGWSRRRSRSRSRSPEKERPAAAAVAPPPAAKPPVVAKPVPSPPPPPVKPVAVAMSDVEVLTATPEKEDGEDPDEKSSAAAAAAVVADRHDVLVHKLRAHVGVVYVPLCELSPTIDFEDFLSYDIRSDIVFDEMKAFTPDKGLVEFIASTGARVPRVRFVLVGIRPIRTNNMPMLGRLLALMEFAKEKFGVSVKLGTPEIYEYDPNGASIYPLARMYKAMWQSGTVFTPACTLKSSPDRTLVPAFLSTSRNRYCHLKMLEVFPKETYAFVVSLVRSSSVDPDEFQWNKVTLASND